MARSLSFYLVIWSAVFAKLPTSSCYSPLNHQYQTANLGRLSDFYSFKKPNDRRALDLMNAAAVAVMKDLPDLCIAYGVSDEYRYDSPS